MATTTYFLGANTPEGFQSRYDTLFHDSRIQELIILKGGPGCGKSTLMRTLSAAAASKGCAVEEILCSSDPDSLDALIIPAAGLALVDGTAPHVVEPPLCGLGARYLDLGQFYDGGTLSQTRASLLALKEKNAACYPLAYHALQAARAASDALRQIAAAALPPEVLADAKTRLMPRVIPMRQGVGEVLLRYTTALTPKGCICAPLPCPTLYVLQDSYGLAAPFLASLRREFRVAGHRMALGFDPLHPHSLQSLLLPELEIGYAVSDSIFSLPENANPVIDFDALVEEYISFEAGQRLQAFAQLRELSVREALVHLANAKRHHDALEQLYRPAVDFAGLDRLTASMVQLLEKNLSV